MEELFIFTPSTYKSIKNGPTTLVSPLLITAQDMERTSFVYKGLLSVVPPDVLLTTILSDQPDILYGVRLLAAWERFNEKVSKNPNINWMYSLE
ncbi:MAG: hypothetical protein P9F19_19410 [Candidatus Contendobacter sp.]|nr:hypothetical protein [Candidatus Contendobacter sp.]MDG4559538.1 hypothetical protein [Candidatus Contendobacter sp.]